MAGSPVRLAGVAKRMISTRVERSESPSGQGCRGDERRGQGSGGGQDHVHLFDGARKVGDHAGAHLLGLDEVHGGEAAGQCQVDAHIRAVLAVVLRVIAFQGGAPSPRRS